LFTGSRLQDLIISGATLGRLQRKKSAKKKKRDSAAGTTPASDSRGAASAATETARVEKKLRSVELRKSSALSRPAPAKIKDNFITRSLQFLREVKMELKKVTWPSRKQTIGSTVVVLVLVTIIAFFLGAVDIGLSSLVKVVLQ
jgi:preprotein translocase subunit SecE